MTWEEKSVLNYFWNSFWNYQTDPLLKSWDLWLFGLQLHNWSVLLSFCRHLLVSTQKEEAPHSPRVSLLVQNSSAVPKAFQGISANVNESLRQVPGLPGNAITTAWALVLHQAPTPSILGRNKCEQWFLLLIIYYHHLVGGVYLMDLN